MENIKYRDNKSNWNFKVNKKDKRIDLFKNDVYIASMGGKRSYDLFVFTEQIDNYTSIRKINLHKVLNIPFYVYSFIYDYYFKNISKNLVS